MIIELNEKNGTKYPIPNSFGDEYILPHGEFMLHKVKEIQSKLLEWYKQNIYNQGDSYTVRITNKGKWAVSHSNDYPMQHGDGSEHIFSEDEFMQAMGFTNTKKTK